MRARRRGYGRLHRVPSPSPLTTSLIITVSLSPQPSSLTLTHTLTLTNTTPTQVVQSSFPSLRVELRPLSGMKPGEEGCPGSFEVLWEAFEWQYSRLLHSRLATGKMPRGVTVVRGVLQMFCGPAMPSSQLGEWHARILEVEKEGIPPPLHLPALQPREKGVGGDAKGRRGKAEGRGIPRAVSLPALLDIGGGPSEYAPS